MRRSVLIREYQPERYLSGGSEEVVLIGKKELFIYLNKEFNFSKDDIVFLGQTETDTPVQDHDDGGDESEQVIETAD